jgi:hypothetical protein
MGRGSVSGVKNRLTDRRLPQDSLLEDFSSQTPLIISEYHKDSLKCDEEEDLRSRVLMRQKVRVTVCVQSRIPTPLKILWNSGSTEAAYRVVGMVLNKLDAIRFADDFNELTQQGKSNWLDEAYVQAHESRYEDLSDDGMQERLNEDRDEIRLWKREVGRATTARNRLFQLFLKVRARRTGVCTTGIETYSRLTVRRDGLAGPGMGFEEPAEERVRVGASNTHGSPKEAPGFAGWR